MGVRYSRSKKSNPKGMFRSWMALLMLAKNQMTSATTKIPDTICSVTRRILACRQTGIPS